MDSAEASRQVNQMVAFIKSEAKDKAEEIEAKAMEDFSIEKLKLVQQQKEKIRAEMTRKAKQLEAKAAIAKSTRINAARLRKMEARNAAVERVAESAMAQLEKTTQDSNIYSTTVSNLLVQGLIKLYGESQVYVRCRAADDSMVENCLSYASKAFAQLVEKETGRQISVSLMLDRENKLPANSLGGVQLCVEEGCIVVDNTFDARLKNTLSADKPALRAIMFPTR